MTTQTLIEEKPKSIAIARRELGGPSPLVQLPPELLVEICWLWITGSPDIDAREKWAWTLTFSHVCRYWRNVALNAPILWKFIVLDTSRVSLPVTQELLRRSCNASIHLCVRLREDLHEDIIAPKLPRVQSLFIGGSKSFTPQAGVFDVPLLQELRVEAACKSSRHRNKYFPMTVPIVDARYQLPHLQRLKMTGILYTDAYPFFRPTLRELTLHYSRVSPSIAEFLNALQGMPALEELSIASQFRHYRASLHTLPYVQFPQLCRLAIRDDAIACARILSHLELPASTFLGGRDVFYLEGYNSVFPVAAEDEDGRHGGLCQLFSSVVAKLTGERLFGSLPRVRQLLVTFQKRFFNAVKASILEANNDGGRVFRFYSPSFYVSPCAAFDCILSSPSDSFCADLEALDLKSFRNDTLRTLPTSSPSLATRFTNLRTIHLAYTWGVWRWIAQSHTDEFVQADLRNRLPFPALRELRIKGVVLANDPDAQTLGMEDFLPVLLSMLSIRKKAGAALDSLGIHGVIVEVRGHLDCRKVLRMLEHHVRVVELHL